jgi:predicted enzyme related to lactoylglutathione lyase
MAGEMVHFELAVKDVDAAQAFWGGLFGWQFGPPMSPEMDYRMAQIDDKSGAAIMGAESPKTHPNVYLDTNDIDASIVKAKELGGSAEAKSPVPGHGWFAACKDPEGIEFHLWQADASAG